MTRQGYVRITAPEATGRCVECEGELPPRKRKWCSQACIEAFGARHSSGMMRQRVLYRDNWTCGACGLHSPYGWNVFDVDHIVPVAEGGGEFDETNCRILCKSCHKRVTAEWHRGRARRRAFERAGTAFEQPALFEADL